MKKLLALALSLALALCQSSHMSAVHRTFGRCFCGSVAVCCPRMCHAMASAIIVSSWAPCSASGRAGFFSGRTKVSISSSVARSFTMSSCVRIACCSWPRISGRVPASVRKPYWCRSVPSKLSSTSRTYSRG